ncbi:MAG: hypothetical protein R3267_05600 [Paenisporosarcina sp.]|nr:hypothetical protein [Paenisporosarcina sp.]
MVKNVSNFVENRIDTLSCLGKKIRQQGVYLQEIKIEYRLKTKKTLIRCREGKALQLSSAFYDKVESQLEYLQNHLITPFTKKVSSSFVMTVKLNSNGDIDFETIELTLKANCKEGPTAYQVFTPVFNVFLPFAEYIDLLSIRGRDGQVTVLQADVIASLEDLLEVVNYPIVMDRVESHWMTMATKVMKEAKSQAIYDVEVMVTDGDMIWDAKVSTLSFCMGG